MGKLHSIRLSQSIDVPAERAWEKLIDHRNMGDWMKDIREVKMPEEGSPPNGPGAVREISTRGPLPAIVERVTDWEPVKYYRYVIVGGVPGLQSHEGFMRVNATGEASCVVSWEIDIAFRSGHLLSLAGGMVASALERAGRKGFGHLKKILEEEA